MPTTVNPANILEQPDIVLVGSGIMSANLAVMLKRLEPSLSIQVFEVTDELAQESSNGWNNAGTGHAGICEISYTPFRDRDGTVPIGRAVAIFEQFEHSKQFWAYCVEQGIAGQATEFLRPVPHIGFVRGESDVEFLKARQTAMAQHHFFESMELTTSSSDVANWAPLVMEGRADEPVAATKMDSGTEVDFGALARMLWNWFRQQEDCHIASSHRVTKLSRDASSWRVTVRCLRSGEERTIGSKFVFVGAGGGSLPLLQTTGLSEVAGLGGFPIGGQWLVCDVPDLAARHSSKVYGMTPPSAPSLGGPHLDVRWLKGKRQLMFGPFASWTTKYLKTSGRWFDLPSSVRPNNLMTFLRTAMKNRQLVTYLVAQGLQSMETRMSALREFYPLAKRDNWQLVQAGIRVQTLKREDRGKIYFGTEVFTAGGNTLAALLGASPGASVSVNIALGVIQSCLPELLRSSSGYERMKKMIPIFDVDIKQSKSIVEYRRTTAHAETLLGMRSGSP